MCARFALCQVGVRADQAAGARFDFFHWILRLSKDCYDSDAGLLVGGLPGSR